jgi:short-chain fatty acids transporter
MKETPWNMMIHWGDGFWNLITFTGQIMTTFVMSYALALTPPVARFLEKVASKCKTPGQAIVTVTFIALGASLISWAFGLVVGGIMARLLGRQVKNVDYRVLVAAAYSGYVVWHGGLSSSSGLFVATEGHALQDIVGIIPTSETMGSMMNLAIVIAISLTLPFVMKMLHPKREEDRYYVDQKLLEDKAEPDEKLEKKYFNDRLDGSRLIVNIGGILGLIYLFNHFFLTGGGLDLNIVNLIFITFVLLFYRNTKDLGKGLIKASGSVGQLALQYPFYAGIMGMLAASGLALWISDLFVNIANEKTLPILAFYAAGFVNMFVPSGGGQFAIQGPIFLPAAVELGVDPAKIVTAIAWGDNWTNMLQPFWAIPLLAIAGLRIKDIMGFTFITLIYTGIIISAAMLIFA